MDRLTSMHVFRNVVDCGSFSVAARRLGMSNAAVTKHIQQLEGHLRVALLNRTTRKLALTDTGADYYGKCNSILDQVEATELAVKDVNKSIAGSLRVNAPMDLLAGRTRPILSNFRTRFPDVSLDLHLSDDFVDPIDGGFDITLRVSALPPDSSLSCEVIGSTELLMVASPDFLRTHQSIETPDDLRKMPLLAYGHSSKPSFWEVTSLKTKEVVTLKAEGPLKANSGLVLMDAAVAKVGIALLPRFIVQQALDAGALVTIDGVFKPQQLGLYALFASNHHISGKIRNFVDFARDEFANGSVPWPAA